MVEERVVVGLRTRQMTIGDSKEHLSGLVNNIKRIEKDYQTKLLWTDNLLDGSLLINAIKSRVVALESRSDIQTIYLETVNKRGDTVTTEFGYQTHSTSQKNAEYEWAMMKIIKKDEAIKQVNDFVFCFNRLERLFRIILYYSFFEKESALRISQMRLDGDLTYASRSVLRKRTEGADKLVKTLQFAEWLKTKEREER